MSLSQSEELELLALLEAEAHASVSFPGWLTREFASWTWDWRYQRYIQSYLDRLTRGDITKLMVFCPPRHGKSEMTTIRYPVWRLMADPGMRVIIGAYNQTLADKFSRKCRRIARERMALCEDRTAVHDWETPEGGGIRAIGVGAGITGQGGDLIIIDDPIKSREEAESETYRNRVYDWYTDDLYTRLEPGGSLVLIMTRWHEDDLAGRILASEDGPNWRVINLPAEAEEHDPLGRAIGEPLCPDRFDSEALADRKRVLGTYAYTALYQQRPAPAEGGIIKRAWLRYYDTPPAAYDRVIQSWDMAFKDAKENSFVCGQVWGQSGGNFYLIDQIREHLDFPGTQAAVERLSTRYPQALAKLVEDKANGPAIVQSLSGRISGLTPITVQGSKVARAAAISPLFEAGNVYLPRFAGWADDYVNELCTFPNAAHDDQVDCTSQGLAHLSIAPEPWFPTATTAQRPRV
jgi:predicted phage terminase large subunit-like protein